ncbi:MAG: histidine kinase [Synechococcales cyanobacterium C42_A2020_086]|jgi:two-component system clock-associated histidine kinase SasA|nr:histidine kinase [Synechococcales cyanobacterium C42_A2020_086]
MEAPAQSLASSNAPLQLLLFVDERPLSRERTRQIRKRLQELALNSPHAYTLQVVKVAEQPHLVEHFKLVATPSLIKISPEPRQILAGTNLVAQIENWWTRWQNSIDDALARQALAEADEETGKAQIGSIAQSAEVMRLTDENFQLKREIAELENQLQFKDHLMAVLAHDLRNPLTALSIALETLEMGIHQRNGKHPWISTPELMAQMVKQAREQARSLDRLITDLLQVARDSSAALRIQPRELDLGKLCLEVLDRLQHQFQAKSHQVSTDIPGDLPKVYADPERVKQVLINLLDNAIKYTPAGGAINLSILHRTTQKVQVSVCDNGLGIPAEEQARIFEARVRLKRDETTDGYGFGLSVCKQIVQAHYGHLWVDSEPNQGSCFHFTLPVYYPVQRSDQSVRKQQPDNQ